MKAVVRLVGAVSVGVPLFGAFYCWRDGLIFGGFCWLVLAIVLAAAYTFALRV